MKFSNYPKRAEMKRRGLTPTPTLVLFRFLKILPKVTGVLSQEFTAMKNNGETKKLHQNWCRGFTLVEMLIYIAIFSVFSIVAVNGTIQAMKSFYALRLTQNINRSATTAMERMAYEIRNAYGVDTANSTLGSSPGRLTLFTKDGVGNNTTVEFYVVANQLGMKVGSVDQGLLMVKTSILPELIFSRITTPNSTGIKIDMTVRDTRQDVAKTTKYYDTIELRGSLH